MKYLTLLIISCLTACSTNPPIHTPSKPIVIKEFIYPDCGHPPMRSIVEHKDIIWYWSTDIDGNTIYYLTPKGYKDLSFNTSEIIKGAKELKAELAYYMDCIKNE